MPLNKKRKQQAKQDATEDDVEDKEAEKRKLKRDIETLETKLKVLEEDEKQLDVLAAIENQKVQKKDKPTSNEQEIFDIYGFQLKIDGDKFTFAYPTLDEDGSTLRYFIQISEVDKKRELMKHHLPASINMDVMLEQFDIKSNKKILRLFFALKRLILCYQNRKQQVTELKAHLKNFKNCEVQYQNDGVTQVLIRFYCIENKLNKQTFHFDLTVYYEPDERLPLKFAITPSSVTSDEFDDDTLTALQWNFAKPFKNVSLKEAIDNLIQPGTGPLVWKSTTNTLDEDFELSLSEDDCSLNEFVTRLKKKFTAKSAKQRKNKNENEPEETSDGQEETEKNRRGKKRKREHMMDKRNQDGQRTQMTMDSFAIRKETSTKSLNATATEENDNVDKIVKTQQTRKQTKVQENPVKKKKAVNQSQQSETATDEQAMQKSGEQQQSDQETELQENQSENELSLGSPTKSPAKKTEDQSPHEAEIDDSGPLKKSGKLKRTQEEVKQNQKKSKQPAESPVKDTVKKMKTVIQSPSKTAVDELKAVKKTEKKKRANDEAAQENQEKIEQRAPTRVKSSVQKKTIDKQRRSNPVADYWITSKLEAPKKSEQTKKARNEAVQKNKEEIEQPVSTTVKISEQKKKIKNQGPSDTSTVEQEAATRAGKVRKSKEAALQEIQNGPDHLLGLETEQRAATAVNSSVQKKTIDKQRQSNPVADYWVTSKVEAPKKKSDKNKKARDEAVQENQEEIEQPVSSPVKISVQKKKVENQTRNKPAAGKLEARGRRSNPVADYWITSKVEAPKKSEIRKKATDEAALENQKETEQQPALTPVKRSVQKKELQSLGQSKTSTAEQQAATKARKGRKSKEAAIQGIQVLSSSWDYLPDHLLGPPKGSFEKKKETANQSLKQTATDKQKITKKGEKRKKTQETEVHGGDSENEEPAETAVKSPAKKKKKAANLSLNKSKKIDPKQTTLNFANKVEDAKKASKIPVMKKNKPNIVSVQNFSSSTPLVSRSALRSGKLQFSDISYISEIGKDD